jgi:hypothetical protein
LRSASSISDLQKFPIPGLAGSRSELARFVIG